MKDKPRKATVAKPRFEEVVAALMQVGKEEADAIIEAEKNAHQGKKRGPKPVKGQAGANR